MFRAPKSSGRRCRSFDKQRVSLARWLEYGGDIVSGISFHFDGAGEDIGLILEILDDV